MIKSILKGSLMAALGTVIFSAEALAFDLQTLSKSLGSAQLTTGHFVQERELTGFPKPMRTEGVYFLDLKKGIVWETVKPFANTMIFSEKGIKSVNKHGTQVISAQDIPYLKTVNALMLALFSAQTERLDKDFDIHLKGSSAHWTMTLVPKKTSALATVFKTMEITGAASPESIKMVNRQNETTRLQLSKQEKLTRWPDRLEPL
ncbi:MAG TPA: outer membrane lipoprotein carrier protein LolA [Sutterellaceae bacterium]|nr:outer membrane lipoprotein carrier protein LolA [Sutterellaceae bacterium]